MIGFQLIEVHVYESASGGFLKLKEVICFN